MPKVKMINQLEKNANQILIRHLERDANMSEITDAVYAMGMAIGNTMKVTRNKERQRKKKPREETDENENGRKT